MAKTENEKKTVKKTTVKKETAKKAAPVKKPAAETPKKAAAVKPAEKKTRVLFVASEAQPFAGTGGLGDVIGSLPRAVNKLGGFDVRVVMPYYKDIIPARLADQFKLVKTLLVHLSWRTLHCGIFEYDYNGVKFYFIDNEYYFKRNNLYGFYDDGERFAYFCRAVPEVMRAVDFIPDVLHCHDWQSALVPVYYKLFYKFSEKGFSDIKTVFTVHNIEYQGKYDRGVIEDLFGISALELHSLEYNGCINLMKAAMDYSEYVTTVSPTYAEQLKSEEYAHGLSEIVYWNASKLRGIINGIDCEVYNPATDGALFKNYDAKNPEGKQVNKTELQKMLNLTEDKDVPMLAVISRLVPHKGIDIIKGALHDILKQDVQLVILGKGDADYENYFTYTAGTYEKKMAALIAFNKDLSQKIYAAADMLLMPSKSEPCGLAQMIACRYGTLPIAHETGGLFDTVKDCGDGENGELTGNGVTFAGYSALELKHAVTRALRLYGDKKLWDGLVKRIMEHDFSWSVSAKEYAEFYRAATR